MDTVWNLISEPAEGARLPRVTGIREQQVKLHAGNLSNFKLMITTQTRARALARSSIFLCP